MDQRLKQRLVGATVLVALAVLVVPLVLRGPRGPQTLEVVEPAPAPALQPEPARERGFSSRIVPLEDERPRGPEAPALLPRLEPPTPPSVPANPQPAADEAPPPVAVVPEEAVPAAEPSARVPVPAEPEPAGWVVQLGSFANGENARALRDRLNRSGYRAFARDGSSDRGAVTRVYVGPEPERDDAKRLVARLAAEVGLRGIVLRYPP